MDERARFEKWFRETYGARPHQDNVIELEQQVVVIRQKIAQLTEYDNRYQGALGAWHERYSRGHKT